jgi:hypothetical protein
MTNIQQSKALIFQRFSKITVIGQLITVIENEIYFI